MMDFTPLGHACAQFASERTTVLCDPHFQETYGQGLFVHEPRRRINAMALPRPDLVIVSHRHRDHFDVRSLAELPRNVPIACADDQEILYCLSQLGFRFVTPLRDWQELTVGDLRLIITPSLYRVPEHGVILCNETAAIWNMVDSVVDVAIVAEALKRLNRPLDLLLWPYQPLQETFAVEQESLDFPDRELERKLRILEMVKPRAVVPYADGQIGTASAEWLNYYRFPVAFGELAEYASSLAQVLEPNLGQRVRLHGGTAELLLADLPLERIANKPHGAVFDTTREPCPLVALDLSDCVPVDLAKQLEQEVNRLWTRVLNAAHTAHVVAAIRDARATYDLVLEFDGQEIIFRLDAAREVAEIHDERPPQLPGRQGVVRLRADTLWWLIQGELHYISAYLGGAFRTWHSFYTIKDSGLARAVVNRSGLSQTPFVHERELPSPAMLLNMLLASDAAVHVRVLDRELRGCSNAH